MESFVLSREHPRSLVLCSFSNQDKCHGIQIEKIATPEGKPAYSTKILPITGIDVKKYTQLSKTIYGTLGFLHHAGGFIFSNLKMTICV